MTRHLSTPSFRGDESVTLDEVIGFLNQILAIDPVVLSRILLARSQTNAGMQNHPTVQTANINGRVETSALGILNGLFGRDSKGSGGITVHQQAAQGGPQITKFERTAKVVIP